MQIGKLPIFLIFIWTWKSDGMSATDAEDVISYSIQMARVLGVDLNDIVRNKMDETER